MAKAADQAKERDVKARLERRDPNKPIIGYMGGIGETSTNPVDSVSKPLNILGEAILGTVTSAEKTSLPELNRGLTPQVKNVRVENLANKVILAPAGVEEVESSVAPTLMAKSDSQLTQVEETSVVKEKAVEPQQAQQQETKQQEAQQQEVKEQSGEALVGKSSTPKLTEVIKTTFFNFTAPVVKETSAVTEVSSELESDLNYQRLVDDLEVTEVEETEVKATEVVNNLSPVVVEESSQEDSRETEVVYVKNQDDENQDDDNHQDGNYNNGDNGEENQEEDKEAIKEKIAQLVNSVDALSFAREKPRSGRPLRSLGADNDVEDFKPEIINDIEPKVESTIESPHSESLDAEELVTETLATETVTDDEVTEKTVVEETVGTTSTPVVADDLARQISQLTTLANKQANGEALEVGSLAKMDEILKADTATEANQLPTELNLEAEAPAADSEQNNHVQESEADDSSADELVHMEVQTQSLTEEAKSAGFVTVLNAEHKTHKPNFGEYTEVEVVSDAIITTDEIDQPIETLLEGEVEDDQLKLISVSDQIFAEVSTQDSEAIIDGTEADSFSDFMAQMQSAKKSKTESETETEVAQVKDDDSATEERKSKRVNVQLVSLDSAKMLAGDYEGSRFPPVFDVPLFNLKKQKTETSGEEVPSTSETAVSLESDSEVK